MANTVAGRMRPRVAPDGCIDPPWHDGVGGKSGLSVLSCPYPLSFADGKGRCLALKIGRRGVAHDCGRTARKAAGVTARRTGVVTPLRPAVRPLTRPKAVVSGRSLEVQGTDGEAHHRLAVGAR